MEGSKIYLIILIAALILIAVYLVVRGQGRSQSAGRNQSADLFSCISGKCLADPNGYYEDPACQNECIVSEKFPSHAAHHGPHPADAPAHSPHRHVAHHRPHSVIEGLNTPESTTGMEGTIDYGIYDETPFYNYSGMDYQESDYGIKYSERPRYVPMGFRTPHAMTEVNPLIIPTPFPGAHPMEGPAYLHPKRAPVHRRR